MSIPHDPAVARIDHQHAVADFVAAARAVPADRWEPRPDDSHWSPAQIAEHLRLTYEVVGGQFNGGPGLRVRTSWWKRTLIRWKFLGGILRTGVLPKGARAPREIRPADGPYDRDAVLAAVERAATDAENRLVERWSDSNCVMTHHVFGVLTAPQGARFITVHTLHHARQLRVLANATS